ncbi:MAG: glycosyltransferase [Bradymonadia bacterium]
MGKQRKKKKSKASRRGNKQSAPKAGTIDDAKVQHSSDEGASEIALQPFGEGPRFTVLMAAYNRADLIHVAIDSVLAQDFEDYELVIVDDGSTDDTPNVVGRYTDQRIRYVRKSVNEGRPLTRNRAIQEARGEFVLWMADDDLLSPGLLTLYDGILRSEPHVDVIYGKLQLFDHDTGQDLNIFTPNDWTGRDKDVIGAKLYGSCVPDGGTATRRSIYRLVGAGPYDPEFLRAQDYELWTRIVAHASFRFVDEVVYRYRKHSGGTSWGEFIDLTYDSKIIRRHLNRHPLKTLFLNHDWRFDALATDQAHLRVAKNLQLYGDHGNVLRFAGTLDAAECWPEVIELRAQSYMALGELETARQVLDSAANTLGRPYALVAELTNTLNTLQSFKEQAPHWLQAASLDRVVQAAVQFDNSHFQTFDTMRFRAAAHEQAGNLEAALHCYCLAARLKPDDDDTASQTARLCALVGESPKTDLTSMRRRLAERFYELPQKEFVDSAGWNVAVAVVGETGVDFDRAVRSVCAQTHSKLTIHVFGETSVDDPRIRLHLPEAHATWLRSHGFDADFVAWIEAGYLWTPSHLETALQAFDAGCDVVMAMALKVELNPSTDEVVAHEIAMGELTEPAQLFGHSRRLLSQLVARGTGVSDDRLLGAELPELMARDLSIRLSQGERTKAIGAPTVSFVDVTAAESVGPLDRLRFYTGYNEETVFDLKAREVQNQQLNPHGYRVPKQGRTTIVIHGLRTLDELKSSIERFRDCTLSPHEFVAMVEPPDFNEAESINRWVEHVDDVRVCEYRAQFGLAKQINDGFARANGEFVALAHFTTEVPAGWLARMQGAVDLDAPVSVCIPSRQDQSAATVSLTEPAGLENHPIDGHCIVLTRGALDRIGGLDVTLDAPGMEWLDYARRLTLAGGSIQVADGVSTRSSQPQIEFNLTSKEHFEWRWSKHYASAFQADLHKHPFGSEEGFRPDSRPVVLEESSDTNVLVMPPWGDDDALVDLLRTCAKFPRSASVWWRCEPGSASARVVEIKSLLTRFDIDEPKSLLLIDAPLAPERESGLYTAADAIYVKDGWSDVRRVIRRGFDCRRPVFRDEVSLINWLGSDD